MDTLAKVWLCLVAALHWCWQHPAEVALAWPVITGTISVVYRSADASPRLHALLEAMKAAGLDLPTALAWLRRFLSGPTNPPAVAGCHPPPPARPSWRPKGLGRWILVPSLAVLAACAALRDPTTQDDARKAAICVLEHVNDPPALIVRECAQNGVDLTIDAVEAILAAQRKAEYAHNISRSYETLDEYCAAHDGGRP